MTQAGKNLKFTRSGLTIHSHVGVAGEVIPLPPDFKILTLQEQQDMYKKTFYILTDEPVNVGPTAKVQFIRVAEPLEYASMHQQPPQSVIIPKVSESERGGGGGQAQIPTDAMIAPDPYTVPGHEDKRFMRALEQERNADEGDVRFSVDDHGKKTIILKRKKFVSEKKKKKKLVEAKTTVLRRSK